MVAVLAVSKGQSVEKILDIYRSGQRAFGENYLQEALAKIALLPDDIEWHFIGPLQSNKTRKIAEHFAWVQSIDSFAMAKRLSDQRPDRLSPLNICIQVNIDHAANKSGIPPDQVLSLANHILTLPRLKLRGLMAIPEPHVEFSEQRRSFHQMYLLYQSLRDHGFSLDTLSMGMSDDFEAAIAEGSTMIRIGKALFGQRS